MCPTAASSKLGYGNLESAQRRTGQVFGLRKILEQLTLCFPTCLQQKVHRVAIKCCFPGDFLPSGPWSEREAFMRFQKCTLSSVSCHQHLSEPREYPQSIKRRTTASGLGSKYNCRHAADRASLEALSLVQPGNLTFDPGVRAPELFLNPPNVTHLQPQLQTF